MFPAAHHRHRMRARYLSSVSYNCSPVVCMLDKFTEAAIPAVFVGLGIRHKPLYACLLIPPLDGTGIFGLALLSKFARCARCRRWLRVTQTLFFGALPVLKLAANVAKRDAFPAVPIGISRVKPALNLFEQVFAGQV